MLSAGPTGMSLVGIDYSNIVFQVGSTVWQIIQFPSNFQYDFHFRYGAANSILALSGSGAQVNGDLNVFGQLNVFSNDDYRGRIQISGPRADIYFNTQPVWTFGVDDSGNVVLARPQLPLWPLVMYPSGGLSLRNLPTDEDGLQPGDLWRDGVYVKIVP